MHKSRDASRPHKITMVVPLWYVISNLPLTTHVHPRNNDPCPKKQFILECIRVISKYDKMVMMMEEDQQQNGGCGYPPLPSDFAPRMMMERSSITGGTNMASAERALSIPGVIEAGWTMSDILSLLHRNGNCSKDIMDRKKS